MMARLSTFEQLRAEWARGQFHRHSIWDGEEDLLKERALHELTEKILPEGAREFNKDVLHGDKVEPGEIVSVSQTLPFMADFRLVIVKGTHFLSTSDQKIIAESLPSVPSNVCVVFLYDGRVKARQPLAAAVEVVNTFWPLFDNQLPFWIVQEGKRWKKNIDMTAARWLADRSTGSLRDLSQEIEKVSIYVGSSSMIGPDHVKKALLGTPGSKPFEMDHAVWQRDLGKSLEVVRRQIGQGDAPEAVWRSLVRAWHVLIEFHASGTMLPHPLARTALQGSRRVWNRQELTRGITRLFFWEKEYKSGRISPEQAISLVLVELMTGTGSDVLNDRVYF